MRKLLVLLLLAGCGDPLSNRWFEEDELFEAALPLEAEVTAESPVAAVARDVGDPALLPPLAGDAATVLNATVDVMLRQVDRLRAEPITTRSEDERIWGPHPAWGGSVRLIVQRADEALFAYVVEVSPEPPNGEHAWTLLMEGDFLRGESLRQGDGTFRFLGDVLAEATGEDWAGELLASHGQADGDTTLQVRLDGWQMPGGEPRGEEWFFGREQGANVLEHRSLLDLTGGPDEELLTTRARWLPGGQGRADFLLSGGDVGAQELDGSECWDGDLARTFLTVGVDAIPDEGVESACAFERQAPQEVR